jgi:putative PEP-CTERM system histidine kinase
VRDRLIVPLNHLDELIGFVVLAAPPPPFKPNYEDRDLLKMMGRHVAVHLAQYDADRRLAESRQFETYHRLTAFVMHDLRNLAAQLALIVSNAEQHKRNPEFVDDAIGTIANSTERMQRLIDQLQRREMQASTRRIALAEVARRACERCSARRPAPSCGGVVEDAWVDADPERLTMIVEHVIRNAQDATPEDGSVVLSVSLDGSGDAMETAVPIGETSQLRVPTVALTVSDSGAGMSAEFISERLFKPFDTTKGSKGMGIGAYQVREYVKSLGGRIDVASRVGQGTRITLRIPLAAPPQET